VSSWSRGLEFGSDLTVRYSNSSSMTALSRRILARESVDEVRVDARIVQQISKSGIFDLQVSKGGALEFSLAASDVAFLQPPFQISQVFLPPGATPTLVVTNTFLFRFGSSRSCARTVIGRHGCAQTACRGYVSQAFIRKWT
jgi:hypothetical protein